MPASDANAAHEEFTKHNTFLVQLILDKNLNIQATTMAGMVSIREGIQHHHHHTTHPPRDDEQCGIHTFLVLRACEAEW